MTTISETSDHTYVHFLNNVKSKYIDTRIRSVQTVNRNLIDFYWWLGEQIAEKQEQLLWGDGVIERLSKDLMKSFPDRAGFSAQNLWKVRRFYNEYKELPILSQLVIELPWSHNLLIMSKVSDPKAREYYLKLTRDKVLSRDMLALQIKNQAYEHHILAIKQHNFQKTLSSDLANRADQIMKDIYTFDSLGITQPTVEMEMELKMVEKIKQVMMEMGYGFTFIGNQYRIRQNNKDYCIDLLFYNRRLQALIALEIKTGAFKPEYAGKMNFYLNLLDDYVKEPHENQSIGIILCSERDHFEVEYALRDIHKPVGVSEFKLTKVLPKELTDMLPDPKELELHIRRELGENYNF
ncbi:MAG: hypothetical protein A3E81_08225 [Gammaproteobacteria bacterium RIFCSPHIGHO2_12_FULL_36_30]|nr:MAG: hypothetical protein A3E81_08225 [Gammaproteobacteria bacterium RIFCSPHIGHO2_12_FULL_36_30]